MSDIDTNSRPRLSLCMIVRDEEELLPSFLEHVRGLWDELVVVDTGSCDNTPRLLREAGATLLVRTWDDDFSAARNLALDHATGDFILTLDVDELITTEAKVQLRQVLDQQDVGAATVIMRNHLPHGHHRDAPLLRLFRNAPEVRYRFPIHEEIESSLEPYLRRTGRSIVALDGIINHQGYVRARAIARGKKERDLTILARCLREHPSDLYSHYKRLELARHWQDGALWRTAAEEAEAELANASKEALSALLVGGDLLCLIAQGRYVGAQALEFINRHVDLVPSSAELHYYRGQLYEARGDLAAAAADFDRCCRVRSVRNLQMSGVRPRMGLCRLAMARGDMEGAMAHAQDALLRAPRDPEALLAMCTLHCMQSGEDLKKFIHEHAAAYPHAPELWLAYGEVMLGQRHAVAAVTAFEHAYEIENTANAQLQIGRALVQCGDYERARKTLAPLSQEFPEAGIGALVCELCTDRDSNLQLNLAEEQAGVLLRSWLVTALLSANDQTLTNLARRAPTIEHIFPWLPEALGIAA